MVSVRKQYTLGKNERLKSRKQIELLFSKGKKFVVVPFRIFYQLTAQMPKPGPKINLQFGVGVSAKNFKRAVDRNRIKRLTRETWRLQKNELREKIETANLKMNVFIIYTAKELPDFKLVTDKMNLVLKKLHEKIDEIISSNS